MKKLLIAIFFLFTAQAQAYDSCAKFERVYLGGTVDHGQVWWQAGDHDFHELGGTSFRSTPCTAPSDGWIEVSSCLHLRSGDNSGHSRLFNKFIIESFTPGTTMPAIYRADSNPLILTPTPLPTTNVTLDSESLWESPNGVGDLIQYFDASRCWTDAFRATQGQSYQFRTMVLCGQTLKCEVSYGSDLIRRFWPD